MNRVSTIDLQNKKNRHQKIVCCTAYDVTMAKLADTAMDIVLVGDSLGMVVQGHPHTIQVSMEEMIYHTRCVNRGLKRAHLMADMPFLSYQLNADQAVENAGKLLQAGAQSVKLEGGAFIADLVARMAQVGIPVMAHIGMTPQSVHKWGGYRVQGKEPAHRDGLLRDAKILEEKGAFALLLEAMPEDLAREITQQAKIPTIGIGAGPDCDGQILVINDLLGMDASFHPKFLKKYANLSEVIQSALKNYADDVQGGRYPEIEHSYHKGH